MIIYEYKIWCNTDSKWETSYGIDTPTTCPINTAHSIDTSKTYTENSLGSNDVNILQKDSIGNIKITSQPRSGSGLTYISHNFCDSKTWWMNAIKHTDITLSPKVGGVYDVYSFAHNLIDTGNGKITFEDRPMDVLNNEYIRPVIKKNGATIEFNPVPSTGVGGNSYSINYITNEITFTPALISTDVVTATYYSVNDSTAVIKPLPSKKLRIEKVECQFSKNIDFGNRWLVFQPYVYLTAYGVPVAYGDPAIYKSIKDYMNESNNSSFTVIPSTGELTQDVYSFVWQYPASKDLLYNTNATLAEFRVYVYNPSTGSKTDSMVAVGGGVAEYATVTFYCLSESI